MKNLKVLALSAAVAATVAGQAVAGGFAPVVAEPTPVAPEVIVEPEAPRSTFGLLLPLALLGGLVAIAVASDDDEGDSSPVSPE
ncbi:hypothetical protein [Rubellimicrobium roseum]|uniref:Ferrochelatase n=1 Tax=Rubellimicrobium roseum TaxID=687525 RepID=A0A5C4NFC3_9RHOB|nr:hypothetical protein [Rubellimicrobium roseum]TNC71796.1 hypothetical protein FHG71_10250 [Rubellimicrobium roseum]